MRIERFLIGILLLVPFFGTSQSTEKACFSAGGGFYDNPFSLELTSLQPQHHIRFTVNGNRPTAQSRLYTEPLLLDESLYSTSDIYTIPICTQNLFYLPDSISHCIVIRAAVFDENDSCISETATNSYFIHSLGCDSHGLPAVSLCADSLDLFGFENGILVPGAHFYSQYPSVTGNYYMKGIEWERTINIEYYEVDDNSGINQTCGLRTHGNRARRMPQKGMKVYAREEYGNNRFIHNFFESTPINSFKHLLLKPFSSLYPFTGIQDYICSQMAIDLGLEAGHSRPVVLYLNGEYWGVYFMQEKMDERYLEDHFGVDIERCNIIANWIELDCGVADNFNEMMAWLDTVDLSVEENYLRIESLVDVDNFIDYMILETFIDNCDWPANNSRCWQEADGKWRWMFFDGDAAFQGFNLDAFGNSIPMDVFGNATYSGEYVWPSSSKSTLLFRKLLQNRKFVSKFDRRVHELCQTTFLYEESTLPKLNRVKDWLRPEMGRQAFRFGYPSSADFWAWGCTLTRDFLKDRVDTYLVEWGNFYDVSEYSSVAFNSYPNPFVDEIRIRFDADMTSDGEINIYDILGRKAFSTTCHYVPGTNEITLRPDLAPGVYLLNIGGQTSRIIKIHR